VAQFKRGDFYTCDAPCPGWHKTVTTPEIIDQIHELILEDRRISAKSIAEQLGHLTWVGWVHHSWRFGHVEALREVGPDMSWTRIKSVNVASRLSKFLNFFGAIQMISCRARLVIMDETWLYHYDTETMQQPMKWQHSGFPRPSKCKNPLEKFSPRFFGIKTTSSSLIIVQRTTLSTASITHLCWCNWRTFWRKNARRGKATKVVLFLHDNVPAHRAPCNPEETGLLGLLMSWSPTLFSGSGPVGLPPVPWTEKNNWKFANFLPKRRSLLPRRPGWMENILNFFERLEKVRSME